MRFLVTALLPLFFICATASGAWQEPGTRPLTVTQAVEAVLAKTGAKQSVLAEKDEPDPWLVADELLARGEHEVALTFAKSAARPATVSLPAYLAGRLEREPESEARTRLQDMNDALRDKAWQRALELTTGGTELDSVVRIRLAMGRGLALRGLRERVASARVLTRAGDAASRLGWLSRAATAFKEAGESAYYNADWRGAATAWRSTLKLQEQLADREGVARTLNNLGIVHQHMGAYPDALSLYRRSLEVSEALGDRRGIGRSFTNLGNLQQRAGDYDGALSLHRRAQEISASLGDKAGFAMSLGNIGVVQEKQGEYAEARVHLRQALDISDSIDDRPGIYRALNNLGVVQHRLGRYAAALSSYGRALAMSKSLGDRPGIARSFNNIGNIQSILHQYAAALSSYKRSLEINESLGDRQAIAEVLENMGIVKQQMGNHDGALASYRRTLALKEALGDRRGMAHAHGNIGNAHDNLGQYTEALVSYGRSLELSDALGDVRGVVSSLTHVANVHKSLGSYDRARDTYERARRLWDEIPGSTGRAHVSWGLASVHLAQGRSEEAAAEARRGVAFMAQRPVGLAEGEGARVRDAYAGLFNIGCVAAVRAGRKEDLLWFLEQGRAGSLREALGSREALEAALVPAGLRRALIEARRREHRALGAYRRTREGGGNRGDLSTARAAWNEAKEHVRRVAGRIQREAKAVAAITMPEPDDLATIQGRLQPSEALVYFALTGEEAVALVVRKAGAHMLALAPSDEIESTVDALLVGGEDEIDPAKIAPLRRLLIEPLGLAEDTTRVFISPVGRLGYVPFSLLLPGRAVVYVPSGTTYGLLLAEQEKRGKRILAFGDPDYRTPAEDSVLALRGGTAMRLPRLPETRREVEAIADVRLLGREATETGVQAAIGMQARWRSVHFACHGLVDPERPMLSALALSADAENDGFLTALEIFRLKIPSDLIVMSACETGKGRIYKTEGIVGLTRAFMFAGSPRVLCSLWEVPDKATRALMIKFYELWNPQAEHAERAMGAAAALAQAQTFIKNHPDHPEWKHPRYWAAWVLWGLGS